MSGRRARYRKGRLAELLAAALLVCKGYRILARRYRTPVGELDLVARRRQLLAVVEVKARGSLSDGLEAVDRQQRQRIGDAAEMFRARFPAYAGHDVRFDVIVIVPWHWPRHIIDAWHR
jgi:putative endonuclease